MKAIAIGKSGLMYKNANSSLVADRYVIYSSTDPHLKDPETARGWLKNTNVNYANMTQPNREDRVI
jgi:hypothetical protein